MSTEPCDHQADMLFWCREDCAEHGGAVFCIGSCCKVVTVIAALERIDGEPTRKILMEKVTDGTYDFGGFTMTFGPNDNQGSDAVYLTVIGPDGKFKQVTTLS
jgi:hypothetical protein